MINLLITLSSIYQAMQAFTILKCTAFIFLNIRISFFTASVELKINFLHKKMYLVTTGYFAIELALVITMSA